MRTESEYVTDGQDTEIWGLMKTFHIYERKELSSVWINNISGCESVLYLPKSLEVLY